MTELQSAIASVETHAYRPAPAAAPASWTASRALSGARIAVFSRLGAVESAWRELEPEAAITVFQNFDYLSTWLHCVGVHQRLTPAVVVVEFRGAAAAIFPLAIVRSKGTRCLTWLGQELSDYVAPITAPEFAHIGPAKFMQLWDEIRALLQNNPDFQHDWVHIQRVAPVIDGVPNPLAALDTTEHPSFGYLASLAGDWTSHYRARRPARARKQERAKLARLGEYGETGLIAPDALRERARLLEALFAQKAIAFRRKGIADMFQRPGYRDFFLALAAHPVLREQVHISALAAGPNLTAVGFGMEYKGRYSLFLVSYDDSFARESPGVLHMNALIEQAHERGLATFDFLIGEQRVKLDWADEIVTLYDHVAAAGIFGVLPALATRACMAVKRRIKRSPALWTLSQRLRAALGPLRGRA